MASQNKLRGSTFILLSSVFFGSYGIWSRMMEDGFDIFSQAWIRGIIVVGILLPIGLVLKSFKMPRLQDLKWFAIITIPGSMVFPLFYYGFINLPIGTSTILFYSALTLTAYVLGFLFFGERFNWVKIVSLLLGLSGLITIFSLSINTTLIIPALVTFIAGLCGGIEVVFTKKLSDSYSPIQLTAALYFVDIIINFTLFVILKDVDFSFTTSIIPWIGLIAYSIAGLLSFTFVTLGYKEVEPSIGGIIGLMEIVFSIIFGLVFFSEILKWSTSLGGLLIICAVALPNIISLIEKKD